MENHMSDALMEFYRKILKPEFDALKQKQAEHDERFAEIAAICFSSQAGVS
jgi:hypothetical protein